VGIAETAAPLPVTPARPTYGVAGHRAGHVLHVRQRRAGLGPPGRSWRMPSAFFPGSMIHAAQANPTSLSLLQTSNSNTS